MVERRGVDVIHCPPDDLFRIGEPRREGDVVEAWMTLDPGIREADGSLTVGSLGVLVDSVLGYASMLTTPGRWSVTTGMTLDAFPALQHPTDAVRAGGSVVQADTVDGYAAGRVHAADGTLVASCTQRLRFLEAMPAHARPSADAPTAAELRRSDPAAILQDGGPSAGDGLRCGVVPAVQNPLGILHGGFAVYACDRTVSRALRVGPTPFVITSLHVSFVRPVPGGAHIEFRPTVVHRGRTLAVVDVVGAVTGQAPAVVARASAQPVTV